MNHIYRSVWSETSGTFVAVSEATSSKGKAASSVTGAAGSGANNAENDSRSQSAGGFALKSLAGLALLMFGSYALASPEGGIVTAGQASIATRGTAGASTTTITQTSQNAALNWSSFNTLAGEAVVFVQPSSSAVALNRVLGSDPTSFLGSLSANGKVFLINPSGILFGKGASVNVGGLVASTLDISNSDFMAGRYKFSGSSNASVVNQGSITAADGGYVALLGANVNNQGVISAQMGSVVLAGGKAMTLDVAGDGLLSVSINQGAVDALVSNGGLIQADGGKVLLSAQAAGALLKTVINNTGVIQAQTLQNKAGVIYLLSDMQSGTVNVGGTLDASAPNTGNGGFIETSAAHVNVAPDARVTTLAAKGLNGSWLIDPADYTIAATGGNQTGAQLSASLSSGNVTILSSNGTTGTAGDINVNDTVSWSTNKLTLNAQNNININKTMDGGAAGSLALMYGQAADNFYSSINVNAPINLPAGQNFSTQYGSAGTPINYTVITALGGRLDADTAPATMTLQGIAATASLTGNYVLGANIDGTPTNTWNSNGAATPVYAGFTPIGNGASSFNGTFDGLGHTVNNLYINRRSALNIGLFGNTGPSSIVRNTGLVDVNIIGLENVGALIGNASGTSINNSYVTGTVSGNDSVGGLVGRFEKGLIINSYSTATVSGESHLGGLVGKMLEGNLLSSYATGAVSGTGNYVGGLAGTLGNDEVLYQTFTLLNNSYSTGDVTGNSYVGGLVGANTKSSHITNARATGNVFGDNYVGGLVGINDMFTSIDPTVVGQFIHNLSFISSSSATGTVTGRYVIGGLVGDNRGGIYNTYAQGDVLGYLINTNFGIQRQSAAFAGGLVGANYGYIISSYVTKPLGQDGLVGGYFGNGGSSVSSSYSRSLYGSFGTSLSPQDLTTPSKLTGFTFTSTPYQTHFNGSPYPSEQPSDWVIVNADGSLAKNGQSSPGATFPMLASEYSTTIKNAHQLQLMAMDLSGKYVLGSNIDAIQTGSFFDVWPNRFVPIGTAITNFTGTFDGGGHTIKSLFSGTNVDVGLFGVTGSTSIIKNVGLVTGSFIGTNAVGSLVGNNNGSVENSYASNSNIGGNFTINAGVVGGLVGNNNGSITNSYASANTIYAANSSNQPVGSIFGGLVGNNNGSIVNAYVGSSTPLTLGLTFGALVGNNNSGTIASSFWDNSVNTLGVGLGSGTGATGLNTAAMQQQSKFAGFDFINSWVTYNGHTSPLLRSFLTPLTVTADNIAKPYDGLTSIGSGVTFSTTPDLSGNGPSLNGYLDWNGAKNAGTYQPSGFYSDQQGYLIGYAGGNLTVTPKVLTVNGLSGTNRTYNGSKIDALTGTATLSGLVNNETLTVGNTAAGTLASANAGVQAVATALTIADGTGLASNYNLTQPSLANVTIAQAPLTVSGLTGTSRPYNGSTVDALSGTAALSGLVSGETLTLGGTSSGTLASANAGSQAVSTAVTIANGNALASNYT